MDPRIWFGVQVVLTLLIGFLLVAYLCPFLYRILLDLCGNEERAQFWLAISRILLIGLPCAFALAYRPEGHTPVDLFFDIAAHLSGNLGAFLFTLMGIGLIVSFFALIAPKPAKE